MSIYYYMHACMIPICLGTSYEVHSYLFSFFMRESFSSCYRIDHNLSLYILNFKPTLHVNGACVSDASTPMCKLV